MRSRLLPLSASSSSRSLLFRSSRSSSSSSLCAPPNKSGRCYSGSHGEQEMTRAPSTAEEFKRVAEEKMREAEQGVASQTYEKTSDGTEEAAAGDGKHDSSVKEKYKRHEPEADHLKDDD